MGAETFKIVCQKMWTIWAELDNIPVFLWNLSSSDCTFDGLVGSRDGNIVLLDYIYLITIRHSIWCSTRWTALCNLRWIQKNASIGERLSNRLWHEFLPHWVLYAMDYSRLRQYNNRPAGGFTTDVCNYAHSIVCTVWLCCHHQQENLFNFCRFGRPSQQQLLVCQCMKKKFWLHLINSVSRKTCQQAFAELQGGTYMLTTPNYVKNWKWFMTGRSIMNDDR